MIRQIAIIFILLLATGCATAAQQSETVNGLRSRYAQFDRISTITHNILVANATLCPVTRLDYGFTFMSADRNVKEARIWIEAFHLHDQPTVTYVIPNGAADRAGLQAGDAIIAVNGILLSDEKSADSFTMKLSEAQKLPHLRLGILRDGKRETLNLASDKACNYSFTLSLTNEHQAVGIGRKIVVDLGAAKLLKRDDELAFFIAHELAHILLGHTLPERAGELDDHKMRSVMEEDADALGVRLMTHAGYDPHGAETALKETDLIDSGPITRFFNYHGAYLPTDKRISYLRKVLGE